MRILFDTNILIHREDNKLIPESLQQLLKTLLTNKCTILVHPLSIVEINKDPDSNRRDVNLSKIQSYPSLPSPPTFSSDSLASGILGLPNNEHDIIDNNIIYAILKDAADFLVTEDKGLLAKATRLSLDQRVFNISDALAFFADHFNEPSISSIPALKEEYIYNLNADDPFFNSLKDEYPGFSIWWKKISAEGRKAWIYYTPTKAIGAILIYKIESDESIPSTPPLHKARRLKICTLKVISIGNKIGELFIKMSVEYAIKAHAYEIYLTHFEHPNDPLVALIEDYGFENIATLHGERVFLKKLTAPTSPPLPPLAISKKYYPSYYDGINANKFIVPIKPWYHTKLFTDFSNRSRTLLEAGGHMIVEGNTITKAYLCHSKNKTISPGDIICFYRSQDSKALTTLGVVYEIRDNIKDAESIIRYVGRRTVFSTERLHEITTKQTKIILFRQHFHMKQTIPLTQLRKLGILKGPPQSITQVSHLAYQEIKKAGKIDERFTVN